MPGRIEYDPSDQHLRIGSSCIEPGPVAVWSCEVPGNQVPVQWFSDRRKTARPRGRPVIGDCRPPSPLGDIQAETWLAPYAAELLDVLSLIGLLVESEPAQGTARVPVCNGRSSTPPRRGRRARLRKCLEAARPRHPAGKAEGSASPSVPSLFESRLSSPVRPRRSVAFGAG